MDQAVEADRPGLDPGAKGDPNVDPLDCSLGATNNGEPEPGPGSDASAPQSEHAPSVSSPPRPASSQLGKSAARAALAGPQLQDSKGSGQSQVSLTAQGQQSRGSRHSREGSRPSSSPALMRAYGVPGAPSLTRRTRASKDKLEALPAQPLARSSFYGVPQCAVCREVFGRFAKETYTGSKQDVSPFVKLHQEDAEAQCRPLPDGEPRDQLCRYHTLTKRRFDILRHVTRGQKNQQRYEALYAEVAEIDKRVPQEVELYIETIVEKLRARQRETGDSVKRSLWDEAARLEDIWAAQVDSIDAQINDSMGQLQDRQAVELTMQYQDLEREMQSKKVHPTASLLELFDQEPRLCATRRYTDAGRIVASGKQLEEAQYADHQMEVERGKSLKLSWFVCQQARQMNGICDKMARHRRQEVAKRVEDKERLRGRVKAALRRLEREHGEERRKVKNFFVQHCYRVRHAVDAQARLSEPGERLPLYVAPNRVSFLHQVRPETYQNVEESPVPLFTECCVGPMKAKGPRPATAEGMSREGDSSMRSKSLTNLSAPDAPAERVGSKQRRGLSSSMGGPRGGSAGASRRCDWCGRRTRKEAAVELPAEQDVPGQVLNMLNSYDHHLNVSVSNVSLFPKGGQQSGPPIPIDQPVKHHLMGVTAGKPKPLCVCCSWACARLWNQKYSPPPLRTRRDLTIDLLSHRANGG
mmetsp:Transcript_51725/g.136743  ORF Transcript_51725/g.136743 Transcript_51725/m.136743 type:complete len:697 (+) Transcript_51725:27-2117(+)